MSSMPTADNDAIADGAYFRQLCENVGVAVIAADTGLAIRFWNSAAGRMFGAAAERMIGTPITSILPQERRRTAERMLRSVLETRQTIEFEFQDRSVQGERRELAGVMAPVLAESGECVGASLCIRDITRRIVLQEEVHESRKMGALGEMAGAMAHHFNNILGGVITSVDYAKDSEDPAVQKRVLDQTAQALLRATNLVNGLLTFACGDKRADDLADFTEVVNELAGEVEQTIAVRNVEFTLVLPGLPVLPVPRLQVLTILRNLVKNAMDAMPDGGQLRIEVSLEEDRVVTSVSDSGCGLDEAARSRIFEPFWSTKNALCGGQGVSTGLGLAIAHGLLQVIGGSITVSSQPGEGSCFKVALPRPRTA